MEESVRLFGRGIARLLARENLTRAECRAAFEEVLADRQPDLQQGAFLAALTAKGETAEEIAGAWEAIDALDTVHAEGLPGPLVDNSGTGMDPVKTFNVSSAAAIVAAAGGALVARHAARALTSSCGAIDLLEALGYDPEGGVEVAAASLRRTGLCVFNGMSPRVHPKALGRILSQIRFGSTMNIAASLANPARPRRAVRGVWSPAMLETVPPVLKAIGMERAWVVHGLVGEDRPGHDELSLCGRTDIVELGSDGALRRFSVRPEDFGLRRATPEALAPLPDRTAEAERFVAVLAGRESGPRTDFVRLNAAAVLCVADRTPDLGAGIALASELIASGAALAKLREWLGAQGKA